MADRTFNVLFSSGFDRTAVKIKYHLSNDGLTSIDQYPFLEGDTLTIHNFDNSVKLYFYIAFLTGSTHSGSPTIYYHQYTNNANYKSHTLDKQSSTTAFGTGYNFYKYSSSAYFGGATEYGPEASPNGIFFSWNITPPVVHTKYTVTTSLEHATCNIASGTQYDEGTEIALTVTADTGYHFTTAPTVDGVDMTRTSDTEYTATVTVTGDVSVVASAVEKPVVKYTVTTSLENATCNIASGTSYVEGTEVAITVTANDGYYFTTAPTVDGVEMTRASDTVYTKTVTVKGNVSVVASAVVKPETYTVTTTLENATCNIASGTEYVTGTEVTITVTANDGYYFTTAPTVDGVNMTRTSDTVYTATVTVTSNVSVVASAVVKPETYTVHVNVSNATCNIDETTRYVMGEPLDIQVEASTGYYFATVPYIGYYIQGKYLKMEFTTVQTTEYKTLYTCTVSGDITSQWNTVNGITIKAIGQVIPTPEIDKYGIITIYNPTSDELTNISKVRYKSIDGGTVDLGQFITRLHRLFVPVTTENRAVVMLGGYTTNVESGVVESDTITVSCGDITVNEVYENENDYKNTQCEIYLPFIGNNTVNTADIMNKVISLEYRINVITGDCLAILKAGGIVVNTFSGNCSFTIPYIMNEYSLVNKVDINAEYLNDFTPYLLIRRKDGVNNGISPIARKAPLNEFSGLVQVDIAFLQINAPRREIDLLESVLQAGVIV